MRETSICIVTETQESDVPKNGNAMECQVSVGLLQKAHSWANTGVLLGASVRRRVAFETINYRDEVSERRKVIVN